MKIKTLIFGILLTPAIMTAQNIHGVNPANTDPAVSPGADFYQFATGGWQKNTPRNPQYSRYGVFEVLEELNKKQILTLFEQMLNSNPAKGTVEQKVKDIYCQGLDSARLNAEGAQPLQDVLERINKAKRSEFFDIAVEGTLSTGTVMFDCGVGGDLMDSNINTMYLSGASFGLPDRDYYLKDDADSKAIQKDYVAFLEKIMTLAGYSKKDAKRAAKNTYDIEYQIAQAKKSRTEMRDVAKSYNVYPIAKLREEFAGVDWSKYFAAIGLPQVSSVVISDPGLMKKSTELFTTLKDQQIKDFLCVQYVNGSTKYLSDDFVKASFDFYSTRLRGVKEQQPRWKRAMNVANGMLSMAVGELYVQKFFSPESKAKMLKIVNDLRVALGEQISELSWMSPETKVNALVKLNSFTVKIGYPDKWKDYSGITVDPEKSYLKNIRAAVEYNTRDNFNKYGKPVDKEEWHMSPQTINAYYNPTSNEICFPAAILQPPFFDLNADDASNYGAIGVVIGHEMTHGFDEQGRNFNHLGNLANWWQDSDSEKFVALAEKLAAQFDAIELLPGVNANGHLTLGENIADQGGLRVAYRAYEKTSEFKEGKEAQGFTPAQRFYIAYATVWAAHITDEEIAQRTKSDVHSIGRLRVNATLPNLDTFVQAFNVKPGDAMWRDESDRVIIW